MYSSASKRHQIHSSDGKPISTHPGDQSLFEVQRQPVPAGYGEVSLSAYNLQTESDSLGTGIVNPAFVGDSVDYKEEIEDDCGCGTFRPRILQPCNNAVSLLIWLSCAAFTQGILVNGLVSVVITTLERRFHLSSSQSGLIASSYDIASLISLIPVSYYGGAGRKPRWLAGGMVIMGLGSLLFSVPHFVAGNYNAVSNATNLCMWDEFPGMTSAHSECASPASRFRYIFIFGQLLHGVGAAPLYTLGVSFLDDSVKSKLSSLYVGIYYACSTLGPAVGYIVGGQLLNIYIDFDRISSWTITESSPGWLGAWWIGFLVMGSVAIFLSIPLFLFPAVLPNTLKHKAARVNETHGDVAESSHPGFGGSIRDLPKSVKLLLMNKTFVCLSFAAACDGFLILGCATYAPKIIQSQFGYSASNAAIIVGGATIPMGAGGTLLGGYIVKRLRLTCSGILKLCVICSTLALVAALIFLIKCPNEKFAGVSVPYTGSPSLLSDNLIATCNSDCQCPENRFDPVCAVESNTMFLTPCHAGCTPGPVGDTATMFYNCTCIGMSYNNSQPVAIRTACSTGCGSLNIVFIVVFAVLILFTFLSSIPGISASLRCVNDSQRPFALGIQWVIVRSFGSVPGPICFGMIIDTVCSYWQKEPCGNGSGRCLLYDNAGMSTAIFATAMAFKAATVTFFILAWWLYKAPSAKTADMKANASENQLTTHSDFNLS